MLVFIIKKHLTLAVSKIFIQLKRRIGMSFIVIPILLDKIAS